MLIRRLITKGFIRTQQLNKKKVQYILTPRGIAEKMQKSVNYTLKTINSITVIRKTVELIVQKLIEEGESNFYIIGHSDFAQLVEMVIKGFPNFNGHVVYIDGEKPTEYIDGVLIICRENVADDTYQANKQINLIEELARANIYSNGSELPFRAYQDKEA